MALDRLLRNPSSLCREPIGHGQQRRIDRLRGGPAQVVPDPSRRQRLLADHEAEDEVIARDRREVSGEPPRGSQPLAERGDHLGSGGIVAEEADPPVALGSRRRLADVVEERRPAQRVAPGQLVGQWRCEQLRHRGGSIAAVGRQIVLDLERAPQDLDRVVVGVEVVVGALADAAHRRDLGEDHRRRLEAVEHPEPGERLRSGEQPGELGELPLAGRLGGARRLTTGERDRLRLGLDADPGGEAGPAEDPQRVVGERALRAGAEDARLEVVQAGGRVDRRTAGERHRDRVDREVAQPQVDLDRAAAHPGDVDLPVAVVIDDPPGVEIAGELERVTADLGGEAARRRGDVAGEGDVHVDDVAAEDRVANRSADDPGAVGDVAEP